MGNGNISICSIFLQPLNIHHLEILWEVTYVHEKKVLGHSMSIQMGYDTIPLRFGSKSIKALFLVRLFQFPNFMLIFFMVLEL